MRRHALLAAFVLVLGASGNAHAQAVRQPAPPPLDAAAAPPLPVIAERHMVAAANPMAAAAGLRVLRAGGSAVDAAIAVQMVLGVVEPQSSGLGGGSLMLAWDARTRKLAGFEGLSSAPAAVPVRWTYGRNGERIDTQALKRSGRLVGVPGALRMLALAHRRLGRMPWARLFDDAIRLADTGFPLPPYLHKVLREQPELAHTPDIGPLYFAPDGQPLPVGSIIRNPALADTLRRIAKAGPDGFYQGPMAQDIVRVAGQGAYGSQMIPRDLFAYQAKERDPVCLDVFRSRVCSAAPPSAGGIAVLQQLAILEKLGIADTAPGSPEAAHLFLEAGRLTAADRRVWLGDPDMVDVPVAGLLDASYLAARAALVHPDSAMATVSAGAPAGRQGALPPGDALAQPATTDVAVIDDQGNAVSFTTTINLNFGANRMVAGFVLNDALTNFAPPPKAGGPAPANGLAPGKRPISTMAPTIVFGADGRPELVVGAGGGARIIDSVTETILGVLAWHKDVRAAIQAPRYGAQNRAEELERNTAAARLDDGLRALGDHPQVVEMNAAVQAIRRLPVDAAGRRLLEGWGDRRRDGVALGD